MRIGGYSTNGYWCLFMAICGYSIVDIMLFNSDYFINGYW